MTKEKRVLLLDLICNGVIVLTTVWAIAMFYRTGPDLLGSTGNGCFRYFTTDSNVLAALAALGLFCCELRQLRHPDYAVPRWAMALKLVGTVAVTITFLTVLFFLVPLANWNFAGFFSGNVFVLHGSTPVLCILSLLLLERKPALRRRCILLALLPTLVYSVVYLVMVVFVRRWYDWYGFTFGGQYQLIPLVLLVMYAFTLVLAWAEWKIRGAAEKG